MVPASFSSSGRRLERLVRYLTASGQEWRDGMGSRGKRLGGKCLPILKREGTRREVVTLAPSLPRSLARLARLSWVAR